MVDLSAESFTAIEMSWKQQEITAKGGVISTMQSWSISNNSDFDAKPSLLIL